MSDQKRNIANILVCSLIILGLFVWSVILKDGSISKSERRHLQAFPKFKMAEWMSERGTSFTSDFEKYAADQFPMREEFRMMNSLFARKVLGRTEQNDLYEAGGYVAKLEMDIQEEDLSWSADRIGYILEKYVTDQKVYLSVIPDKNYYLSKEYPSYPYLDFDEFIERLRVKLLPLVKYVDITEKLHLSSYYYTDTHWKQEQIVEVARTLSQQMGDDYPFEFREETLPVSFEGVYYGQIALPLSKDVIRYLTGDYLEDLEVLCFDTGVPEEMEVYNQDKALGMDPYEFFLSGSKALIQINNPRVNEKKELIIFRDSFSSSMAPLLCGNYSKVTLIDIRYINPAFLGNFVDFEDADILFLYSVQVLNHSIGQFIK